MESSCPCRSLKIPTRFRAIYVVLLVEVLRVGDNLNYFRVVYKAVSKQFLNLPQQKVFDFVPMASVLEAVKDRGSNYCPYFHSISVTPTQSLEWWSQVYCQHDASVVCGGFYKVRIDVVHHVLYNLKFYGMESTRF